MADSPNNLAQLLDRLEETLVATIPETIRQMDVKEKAYCVFVVFHDTTVYEDFRPHLVVAPERLRSKLFATEPHAAEIVWNPTALDVYEMSPGAVTDALGLKDVCHRIYQMLNSDRQDEWAEDKVLSPLRPTMHRVAARLNQFAWSDVLATTDDFVVVAIDDMGMNPLADLEACVDPERLALLDRRGLLANRTANCPKCGQTLRTPQARQCFHCGANWH